VRRRRHAAAVGLVEADRVRLVVEHRLRGRAACLGEPGHEHARRPVARRDLERDRAARAARERLRRAAGVVANQGAYTVSVSPKENGGLFGDAELAWAASNGVPLRIAITAKGDSTPVLELKVTDISFGAVDPADVSITPPAGAKIVQLTPPSGSAPPG